MTIETVIPVEPVADSLDVMVPTLWGIPVRGRLVTIRLLQVELNGTRKEVLEAMNGLLVPSLFDHTCWPASEEGSRRVFVDDVHHQLIVAGMWTEADWFLVDFFRYFPAASFVPLNQIELAASEYEVLDE